MTEKTHVMRIEDCIGETLDPNIHGLSRIIAHRQVMAIAMVADQLQALEGQTRALNATLTKIAWMLRDIRDDHAAPMGTTRSRPRGEW